MSEHRDSEFIVGQVQDRYAKIARGEISGCAPVGGCCSTDQDATSRIVGYSADDLAALPDGANLGLGCGAPLTFLALAPGEVVVDLGAGAGIDAFLAAARVGRTGRVIGVDMTPDMIAKARAHAEANGFAQVEFRLGRLEELPVDDASVDAVTSNCVINLVPDKERVFREVARVLKPGGRLVVSDIVLDAPLPPAIIGDVLAWAGCVAGAVDRKRYFGMLEAAGLGGLTIHRDIDYLATVIDTVPAELRAKISAAGLEDKDLAGIVRSITYGAVKPA